MRKKQAAPASRDDDPFPYTGPIQRADGTRPYNRYLWPTEWWWAHRELRRNIDSRWNFGIVALWDGTFATDGVVGQIEANNARSSWAKGPPLRVVFPTRAGAIRASAARLIRVARNSRKWEGWSSGGLKDDALRQDVIDWIRAVVARETAAQPPKPIAVLATPKPPPPKVKTGLPLFDLDL